MSSYFTTTHATELIFGFIEIFIIVPFLTLSFLRLRKHVNEVYFNRRGKTITISWFLSLTIYNIMLLIIIISYLFYNQSLESFIFSSTISSTVHHMIGSSSIWMNLSRCWQLYYNKKYYQGLQNAKWRSKINHNDTDFYVKYRTTIGNYKTIYFVATLLWLMDGFIFYAMSTFFACTHCEIFAEFPSYLIFYLFATIILCLSRIDDIFFIRKELIYIISFQAFGSLLSFILNLCIIYCIQCNINSVLFKKIIPAFIGCIISLGIIYFGVHWVIKKNVKRGEQQRLYQFHHQMNDNNKHNRDMIPLKEILTDKFALDMFMQHLVREFSIENVLFLIETVNFKKLMIKLGYIDEESVPFEFFENVHKKQGRSQSFSLSMPARMSIINNINDISQSTDKSIMQLSLHESIKVVQNMDNNIHTSLTSNSPFLRSLSHAANKKDKKSKSIKIELNSMKNNDQQRRSRPNSLQSKSSEKSQMFVAPKPKLMTIQSSGTAGESVEGSTALLCETPKELIQKCTSSTDTKASSTLCSPQSILTCSTNITPEPNSIPRIINKYNNEEMKNNKNKIEIKQITLENIQDIDDIIDSQFDQGLANTMDTNDTIDTMDTNDLEEEKYNEFNEENMNALKPANSTPTNSNNNKVIELKSPSVHQIRSHSISKSKSPFTYNSNSISNPNNCNKISIISSNNIKKYNQMQTQRQIDATWINFPKNVPISPFLCKQKGGKYLNPWIIGCEIVEKYIQNSSMLCINISWNVRQTILQFMNKYEYIYQQYYNGRRKSSLSVTFSSLSWKRKNKNNIKFKKKKEKSKEKSVDGSYHPLEDEEECNDDDIKENKNSLTDNNNKNGKKKKEIVDEEEVLKELALLFDDSCMEIYCLLGDSYTRFVTTKPYQILLKKRKNYIKQWIKKRTASVISLNGK